MYSKNKNVFINGDIVTNVDESVAYLNKLHTQNIRNTYIVLEVLNSKMETIGRIEGISTGGSINISSESLTRRSGSVSISLFNDLLPSEKSLLWMSNTIRVYSGVEDLSTGSIIYFLLGTFNIKEPVVVEGGSEYTIDISISDKMSVFEDTYLENKMVFESGTPVHIAVQSLVNYFGEFDTDIEFGLKQIPKKLEYEAGTTASAILQDLRDLYMDNECYYDLTGTFVYRHMNLQLSGGEVIKWRFYDEYNLATKIQTSYNYSDVYNRIVVVGGNDNITGISPKSESKVTDEKSIFHKNVLGRDKTKVITESTYTKEDQCLSRARYEVFKSSNLQEKLFISCVPIYVIDANDVIQVARSGDEYSFDNYIVDDVSYGLGINDEMTISCHKAYYDSYENELSDSLSVYRESANRIINAITNYGWLSVAEKNIYKAFGIGMDKRYLDKKPTLSIAFQYRDFGGVTASTIGYTNNENQTLIIDVMDFSKSIGFSGDNEIGKAEYTDRVLSHEVFHAVMNDYLGVSKAIQVSEWLKEGMAEFLHGADERVKNLVVSNGVLDYEKSKKLVNRAIELIDMKAFKSENIDYGSSYLAVRFLYKYILKNNKTMKDFMYELKQNNSTTGLDKNSIEKVIGMSYDSFIQLAKDSLQNFFDSAIVLNIGTDELDTGSILGSDYTNVYLNAENVMNHQDAEIGVLSYNFEVDIKPL